MPNEDQTTPLVPPKENEYNVQAVKHYVFNETGNIMMATTDETSDVIQQSVRDVFAEVAVFFAAMTKAISTTTNPETNEPYSLYNYTALERVISGSGMFVHVTETDLVQETSSYGVQFSKELLEGLLGLATGSGSQSFAAAMIASVGKEGLRIQKSGSKVDNKVANIVFVCEYLLGMPIVSAIVVYADIAKITKVLDVGPCYHSSSVTTKMELHKDTYMFVTPAFIREYAKDLLTVETDPDYTAFVNYLKNLINSTAKPSIQEVMTQDGELAGKALTTKTPYTISGTLLGTQDKQGTMKFKSGKTINPDSWDVGEITFKVTDKMDTPSPIEVHLADDTTVLTTKTEYSVEQKQGK